MRVPAEVLLQDSLLEVDETWTSESATLVIFEARMIWAMPGVGFFLYLVCMYVGSTGLEDEDRSV